MNLILPTIPCKTNVLIVADTLCSNSITLQWQEADSGPTFVNRDQGSRQKLLSISPEDIEQELCAKNWSGILRSYLNHTWCVCIGSGKNGTEVEIMGKNDISVSPCPAQYFPISGVRCANRRPVSRCVTCSFQSGDPSGGEIHVDHELHAKTKGTSISSARHAA